VVLIEVEAEREAAALRQGEEVHREVGVVSTEVVGAVVSEEIVVVEVDSLVVVVHREDVAVAASEHVDRTDRIDLRDLRDLTHETSASLAYLGGYHGGLVEAFCGVQRGHCSGHMARLYHGSLM
jgi:hypothetical protein